MIFWTLTCSLFVFTLEWIKCQIDFKFNCMFLLKVCKSSKARFWMLYCHGWAVTSRSNPTDFSWTLKICSPKYIDMISQASKLRSHGTLFINSGCFYMHFTFHDAFNLPAFSTKVVHSSHLFKRFSAKSFCLHIKVRISWSHTTPREGVWREISNIVTLNESLRMSHGNFCGGICLPIRRGSEFDSI